MSALLPLTILSDDHIVDPNGWTVAKCYGDYAEANARLIVTAINSHAELLAAAKEALLAADDEGSASADIRTSIEHLRSAIAKAEERAP